MKKQRCIVALMCDVIHLIFVIKQQIMYCSIVKGYNQLLKQTGNNYHFIMEATGVYHIRLMFFFA